jgi:DNA topoisomerase-1
MKKALVIVESPAKARTISKFLGPGYQVEASMGHIRDLPSTAAEMPEELRDQPYSRMAVDVDHGFKPYYIVPADKRQQVKRLKSLAKEAREIFLATDEDREGEAIAWHLLEVLEPKVPVKRMVFHEITKSAIDEALASPRDLDKQLVDAQEARRVLDRLYGYELSPVLWRKVQPRLSSGRVQSVAVRLIVDRERERMRFVKSSYWDIDGVLATRTAAKERVGVRFVELAGKRVAIGKDFDPETGKLASEAVLLDETRARRIAEKLLGTPFEVSSVVEKPFTERPYPPFITSSLQQESARKLRLTPKETMRLAQGLFEGGYITYHRTDSTSLSPQAVNAARNIVTELYGRQFLPDSPRTWTTKVKGAQEAHEAIRPAGEVFRTPEQLRAELTADQLRVYELIWKRTVASQMKDATGQRTTVQFAADAGQDGKAVFSASGKVLTFPGFLRAYVEGSDDPEADLEDQERVLPAFAKGQLVDPVSLEAKGHETQPPARLTEASVIKELEVRGIGRPSTYAATIDTILNRGYVFKKGSALVPTFTAFAVTNLLEQHFGELVDYKFTANMEEELDLIADGKRAAVALLRDFYFGRPEVAEEGVSREGLKSRIASTIEKIDPRVVCTVPLGIKLDGKPIVVRVGQFGPFIPLDGGETRANVPADIPPDEFSEPMLRELFQRAAEDGRQLGVDPQSGKPIYARNGRFGPYVQRGDMPEAPAGRRAARNAERPEMRSLWKGMSLSTVTLEEALMLLSFPKTLGIHPTTGEPITAQDGRFGPYLSMGKETRSLPGGQQQLGTVTLEEAIRILEQPKQGRGRGQSTAMAELGAHPKSGDPLKVMPGRFGPYVTDGVVNASLPKGADPARLTLDEAVSLLEAREAKLRESGVDPRAPKAAKKGTRRTATSKAAKSASADAAPKEKKAAPKKAASKSRKTSAK